MLKAIRVDGTIKLKGDIITILKRMDGIILEFSPPYAPQRNRRAERFMQELSLRARGMMTSSGLPFGRSYASMEAWKLTQKAAPCKSKQKRLSCPTLASKRKHHRIYKTFTIWTTRLFIHIYCPTTAANKKFNVSAIHSCFVGIESDKWLCRIYDAIGNQIHVMSLSDFKPCSRE